MKPSILTFLAALTVMTASAAETAQRKTKRTHAELEARANSVIDRRYGGMIRKAGSARGKVVFLNAQKKVPSAQLKSALDQIEENVHPIWEFKDVPSVRLANPKDDIVRNGGNVGVVLAESADLPALLVAPEEGWAVVNVTALGGEGVADAKLAARTRCELLRAFALAGGCAFMCRGQIVMREDIRKPADLDSIADESYGVDAMMALGRSLPVHGVIPWKQETYKKACREGWAPAPTNEYQKAIWEKIKNGKSDATDPTNRWKRDFPEKK